MDINEVDLYGQALEDSAVDEIKQPSESQIDQPLVTSPEPSNEEGDVLKDYLKHYGINDPSKIQFEDEDGLVQERDWDDLSYQEKMNILTSSLTQPERDLDDNEIALINHLRKTQLSPQQFIKAIQELAISDYQNNPGAASSLNIDALSDDEIFILNLKDTVPDISDEEVLQLLDNAKSNEQLYKKQTAGLRQTLKTNEDNYNKQIEFEAQQKQQQQLLEFQNSILNGISKFKSIGGLDINMTRQDLEELASFILDRDETGITYLGLMLNNPDNLVQMAWFALKGQEAFKDISDYIGDQIAKVRQSSYEKGLADGKKGIVVHRPSTANTPQITSIDSIFG